MKKIYFLALLFLIGCGQQQKDETDPFGKTGQGQKDKEISQRAFEEKCAKTKGGILKFQKSLCFHTPHSLVFDETKLKEKFKEEGDFLSVKVGNVAEGSLIWADVKGGQKVTFYLNEVKHSEVHNSAMAPLRISAGQVTMSLMNSNYEYVMVFVGECFDRKGSTTCDRILQEGL